MCKTQAVVMGTELLTL